MKALYFFMFIVCANTTLVQETNQKTNDQNLQARQLNSFYYGGYHPFYPFPQTHHQTIHVKDGEKQSTTHQQTHVTPHYPMMGPWGVSPYMGMGYINPFLSNPHFFGMNPMYSNFLAMNYLMNPMTMNPYLMNPFNMMQGMEHTTIEETEKPKKKHKEEKEDKNKEDQAEDNEQDEKDNENESEQ